MDNVIRSDRFPAGGIQPKTPEERLTALLYPLAKARLELSNALATGDQEMLLTTARWLSAIGVVAAELVLVLEGRSQT